MKTPLKIGLATILCVSAALRGADPSHRMRVLIKPSSMSEAIGKGNVDVEINISEIDVPAGAPLLSLSTMVPGLSKPQTVEGLTVNDGLGPVPLESRNLNGNRQWSSTRALKGELLIKYNAPIENAPMTQGGPPIAPRIDGDGFSSVGSMFLLSPQTTAAYQIAIDWDLSAMGAGAAAVSSYGDG